MDRENRIWIGSYGGLDMYDPEQNLFSHYRADPGNPDALQSPYVMALAKGPNDTLWAGDLGRRTYPVQYP